MKKKDNSIEIDITIDTDDNKIIVHHDELNSYAVICSKYNDKIYRLSVSQLIEQLEKIANDKRV